VERAVFTGRLTPGARLPTVRGLAGSLGVSPATVNAAYQGLRDRGVVTADGRRGTVVAHRPPLPHAPLSVPAGSVDLASGDPDPALLPDVRPVLARLAYQPRGYRADQDDASLLRAAAAQFAADGIPAAALTVVGGALDGVERVLATHAQAGDRIAVEDPGYSGVIELVRAIGLRVEPMAVDRSGPVPEALAAALRRGAVAVVVTPRAHNPTGACLDESRVRALRRVLRAHPQTLVVEDDHAGAVAGAPALSLCTTRTRRWAVARSVSKSLGPDLRLAVLTGDPGTIARVQGRLSVGTGWVSHVLQQLVAGLWADRDVAALLDRAEAAYAERRAALLAALAARDVPAVGWSGLNVWIPVADELSVVQQLAASGYAVAAGSRYRIGSPPAVRITSARMAVRDAPKVAAAVQLATAPRRHQRSG
jgi:DNA-binding transcriptional MocR family regulator